MIGVHFAAMHATDAARQQFARSWFRGPAGRRYGLQLMLVVIAKLIALTILYFAFIAPQPRTDLSPGAVQQHLLDANSANVSGASP
jgi:hypothetical protein